MSDDDLVTMDDAETGGFDVVLRGYDRHQVEDYIRRVELALGDADRIHREDGERITALEEELGRLQLSLAEAQRRASGQPDPASLVGERLATMLRLAEEEAEQIVAQARERAERSHAERSAELARREAAVASASEAANRTRMEAQQDAEALRSKAKQDADALLKSARQQADELLASAREEADQRRQTAEEDITILHDEARARERDRVAEAEAQLAELSRQRDTIAGQLEDLRRKLSEAMRPLGTGDAE